MTIKTKLLSIIYFSSNLIFSQNINLKGKIIDSVTNLPISYANIGIIHTEEGGISNEIGEFNFKTLDSNLSNEIIFSAMGYSCEAFKVKDLKENMVVKLKPITNQLDEVIITSKKYKTKIIGKEKRPILTKIHFFNDENPAVELGTIFKIPSNTRLKKFNFHIPLASKFKEVKLKLNIYGVKDYLPSETIINQNIIFTVKETEIGWISVDLTSYRIKLKGYDRIAITCQLLEKTDLENTPFSFGFSTFGKIDNLILKRNRSQSQWRSYSGNLLANCEVSYLNDKNSKNNILTTKTISEQFVYKEIDLKNYYINLEEERKVDFGNDSSKGKYITLNDAKIYYETYGSGEPLVLLHGNGGEISNFFKQIPELSKKYKLIVIDTRGQGKSSDFSTGKLTYEKFSEDLIKILDTLKLTNVNLLGWSDGGNTALITAYKNPKIINKVIVVGANLNPAGVEDVVIDETLNKIKEMSLKNEMSTFDYRLKQLLVEEPNINLVDLNKISAKTLIMVGERDVIKPEHTNLIKENIKNSKLVILKDASHYLPQEQSKAFNQIVIDFLNN